MFDQAINDLFADPNLAVDGIWRAGGTGPAVAARVIVRRPDRIAEFGETRISAATTLIEIRVADASTLAEGDTLEIEGIVYIVQGAPMRDSAHLVWTVEVHPA